MSKGTRLSDDERAILSFLGENAEYQVNTWAIQGGGIFGLRRDLDSLKRRGLIGAEGREPYRQWWITDKGKDVLAQPTDRSQ